ncbi:UNVERIFIED_CONTAM: hypothetical protein RKD50_000606 [Streptomyces canus]
MAWTAVAQRHVLLGGQLRQQLAELEHEPEPLAAQGAELVLAQVVDALAAQQHLTAVGSDDPSESVQQCGLAGPGRAHDRQRVALVGLHIHPGQGGGGTVLLDQAVPGQNDAHGVSSLLVSARTSR